MPKWPNWRELKKTVEDPQRREELLHNVQSGVERGRDEAAKRLSGPASHLRKAGSQFMAGFNGKDDDQTAPPASRPEPPADRASTEPQT